MFHEFGHALQHMMTQQAEGLVAGIRGVEWDAVELPSQFMENWCYNRATLNTFGRHYETGEALPEDLYKKLVAARTFRQATTSFTLSLCLSLFCSLSPFVLLCFFLAQTVCVTIQLQMFCCSSLVLRSYRSTAVRDMLPFCRYIGTAALADRVAKGTCVWSAYLS